MASTPTHRSQQIRIVRSKSCIIDKCRPSDFHTCVLFSLWENPSAYNSILVDGKGRLVGDRRQQTGYIIKTSKTCTVSSAPPIQSVVCLQLSVSWLSCLITLDLTSTASQPLVGPCLHHRRLLNHRVGFIKGILPHLWLIQPVSILMG